MLNFEDNESNVAKENRKVFMSISNINIKDTVVVIFYTVDKVVYVELIKDKRPNWQNFSDVGTMTLILDLKIKLWLVKVVKIIVVAVGNTTI